MILTILSLTPSLRSLLILDNNNTNKGAAFFATKDVLKGYAKQAFGSEYRELTTIAAVFLANLPYCTCLPACVYTGVRACVGSRRRPVYPNTNTTTLNANHHHHPHHPHQGPSATPPR